METVSNRTKVLIVEDEALVNLDIAEALRDDGFEVLQAYNGEQALQILAQNSDIRVLFTDINLGGAVDGIALAEEADRRWPMTEVLITSANLHPALAQLDRIRDYGRFVPKPYPVKAVTRRIHEIVESLAA
jgi:two-component system, response regulator PdtaR